MPELRSPSKCAGRDGGRPDGRGLFVADGCLFPIAGGSCAVKVLAQIPVMAWIRPSAMALTKVS